MPTPTKSKAKGSPTVDYMSDLSFIGMVDFTQEAKWIYMTDSVQDLLGWQVKELVGKSSIDLVHPDERSRLRKVHHDTITDDKAACVVYIRMQHKNRDKGYILCGVTRTVCHNVVVGSVSYASAPKGLMMASTAQEVTVLSPDARNLFAAKWNDPTIMPLDPEPSSPSEDRRIPSGDSFSSEEEEISYGLLPSRSFRTALFLDRFSIHCHIQYCSNDLLLSSSDVLLRPFFDYVAKKDEKKVHQWIEEVKGVGPGEGRPVTGGFVYGKFTLLVDGRLSVEPVPEPQERGRGGSNGKPARGHARKASNPMAGHRPRVSPPTEKKDSASEQILVDCIISAHSDGLLVILRRSPKSQPDPTT